LIAWHIKSTTKAQHGLYEYDAVARLRDSQLGDARVHDIRNYILKGKLWHAFLPVVVLTYPALAGLSRYARSGMLEVVRQDYIRTARAKGLSEQVVIYKHALRNGLIPIITLMATILPTMISGSVIVEFIFSVQGMGLMAYDAVVKRDYSVIMAVTTASAVLTLVGLLISDILYVLVDPRISFESKTNE